MPLLDDAPPMCFQVDTTHSETLELRQVVAQAVLTRLHEWCRQLFCLALLCVLGSYSDSSRPSLKSSPSSMPSRPRRNLAQIEMQLLRHLTSPQLIPVRRPRSPKRRAASRPPSPQLFDIHEEPEEQAVAL